MNLPFFLKTLKISNARSFASGSLPTITFTSSTLRPASGELNSINGNRNSRGISAPTTRKNIQSFI